MAKKTPNKAVKDLDPKKTGEAVEKLIDVLKDLFK